MDEIEIWVDGSCSPNPGIGGWAFVIPEAEIEVSGGEPDTTNQRMELTAAIRALEVTREGVMVSVISDSRYVVDCFRQGWWKKWERNGWKNASKQPVVSQDLWVRLIALVLARDVTFFYVKGHAGAVHNERAHDLATASVEVLRSRKG